MRKEVLKEVIAYPASFVPLSLYKKLADKQIIVPLYHLVADHPPVHIRHLYHPRTISRFSKDLDFFTSNYNVISPDILSSGLSGSDIEYNNGFILTFDDGLREVYDLVAPFLYKMGIPAIFFINNDFTGNRNLFYRYKASILIDKLSHNPAGSFIGKLSELFRLHRANFEMLKRTILNVNYNERSILDKAAEVVQIDFNEYLRVEKPYMDSDQIRELHDKGFIIGAHSRDHQLPADLNEPGMLDQVRVSMDGIVEEFSPRYRFYAFPFTDHGIPGHVLKLLHDAGAPLLDASFGTAGLKMDIVHKHIQRIPMEKTGNSASMILKTEYLVSIIRKITGNYLIQRASVS